MGDGDRHHCQLLSYIELLYQPFLFYPLWPIYGAGLNEQEDNFLAVSFKVQTSILVFKTRRYFTVMHTFLCIIDHDVRVDIFNASSATILDNLPQLVSEQTQPK